MKFVGIVLRVLCGTMKSVLQSIYVCFCIIFIYIVGIALLGVESGHTNVLTGALPFFNQIADFGGVALLMHKDFSLFAGEMMQLLFVSTLVSLLGDLTKQLKKQKIIIWYIVEALIVMFVFTLNFGIRSFAEKCLPEGVVKVVPWIIMILAVVILLLVIFKLICKTLQNERHRNERHQNERHRNERYRNERHRNEGYRNERYPSERYRNRMYSGG